VFEFITRRKKVTVPLNRKESEMYLLYDSDGYVQEFQAIETLKEYIEIRHAEEGGFDWISEIKDNRGHYYGCSWQVEIDSIG
jgi:hypothetical protein